MKEVVKMAIVLTLICTVCGAALSGIRNATAERIEYQVLMNVQGPKVKKVLEGSDNDLIQDRKKIEINGEELLLFVGKKGGKPWAIAFETMGNGYGGDIKVMVGYNIEKKDLTGLQVVSHKETPGLGSRVTEDPFTSRFKGLKLNLEFPGDGQCPSSVDAISGATYSSRGVCEALKKSLEIYPNVIKQALKS
jgi:electron transport complex protein RnfG